MSFRLLRLVSFRGLAICGVAVWVSMPSGCQIGRRWFQFDSNSGFPVMGIELRAAASPDDEAYPERPGLGTANEVLPVEHIEPAPRRSLRDWLRIPRGEERIPLPLTTVPNEQGEAPSTGPRPEFE